MRLFHRTSKEAAMSVLREGFKDRSDPTGTNLGFYAHIQKSKPCGLTKFRWMAMKARCSC